MTTYGYGQLERLWINAGGPRHLAPLMAAIALAESGGRSGALNKTDNGGTQTSVGLWQVSNGTHSYPAAWSTPAGNAKEAVAKYNTQGLSAWGTYDSGAYKQFYNGAVPPSAHVTGSTSSSGGGGGARQSAQLDSVTTSAGGMVKDMGALLHGSAVVLDRVFGLFAPGNGWRIVFFAAGTAAGAGAYKAWIADSGSDEAGHLPVAIGLTGIAVTAAFFALRPWPQTSSGPIKPGAYVVDVLKGEPPPPGPESFSPTEVRLTETGLAAAAGLWAAGKAGNAISSVVKGIGAGGGALAALAKLFRDMAKGAEDTGGGEIPAG